MIASTIGLKGRNLPQCSYHNSLVTAHRLASWQMEVGSYHLANRGYKGYIKICKKAITTIQCGSEFVKFLVGNIVQVLRKRKNAALFHAPLCDFHTAPPSN